MNAAANTHELDFRESVDLMFNRAVSLIELPEGLEEKIRVCNPVCDFCQPKRS